MKRSLKLGFADFYRHFPAENNYFTNLLREHYDVEIVAADADLMICSSYGMSSANYRGRKLLVIMENFRPILDAYDAVISFDYLDDPRHFRLPLSMIGSELRRAANWSAERELAGKTRFCNFIFSNPSCGQRNQLMRKLSRYKRVDCAGRCFNNVGGRIADKLQFQRECKFTIAFENSSHPGYLTEKLTHAFQSDTIPLYWGDKYAGRDFNPAAFLHQDDFESIDALVERVIELDQNDDQYLAMLSEPCYPDGQMPDQFRRENVLKFLIKTIESNLPPIGTSPGHDRASAAYAAEVKRDIWRRRLNRWKYRAAHVITCGLAA